MNEMSQLLKVIQILKLLMGPVFFVPLNLTKDGFSASRRVVVVVIFIPFITVLSSKVYFFGTYRIKNSEYYIQTYSALLAIFLSLLSYIGYAVNSSTIAAILNKILSQSRSSSDHVFCRKVTVVLVVQIIITHSVPILLNVWCSFSSFFDDYVSFWEFTMNIWFDYFLRIHLTATTILFSDAILLANQIIAKVNRELVKMDRVEWCCSVESYLTNQEKIKSKNRVISSNSELASTISLYDSVCQWCVDLNASFGCSVTVSYFCNLIQMILVMFFITKYGVGEVWIFPISVCYNFFQNWFLLYACETFTKEVQKTGIIVNRLILETKNQKQKELLQQFSIFLIHRKIKFTAWGLFTLDYKLVYSALATTVTYLTLVYQIDSESKCSYDGFSPLNLSSVVTSTTAIP